MRPLLAVASLEVERRWLLLPLAAALGFAPFAVAPLLDVGGVDPPFLGRLFAALIGALAALALGSSVIAGDLAQNRLSFLFARPLAWWAIWGGKMLAAALLTFLAGLLTLLPSLVLGDRESPSPASLWSARDVLGLLGLALFVLGLAHVGSLALRARTWWLALDLGMLAFTAWAVGRLFARIELLVFGGWMSRIGFFVHGGWLALLWTAALALLAAGAVQVAAGRSAADRSHRVASLTLWPIVLAALAAWRAVLADPSLEGLDRAWVVSTSPRGDRALVGGTRDRLGFRLATGFVVDASTDRVHWRRTRERPSFSGDGSRALWVEREPGAEPTLLVARLDRLDVDPVRTPLSGLKLTSPVGRLVLSPGENRLAALGADGAFFLNIASGSLELTLAAPEGRRVQHVDFLDEERVLVFSEASGSAGSDASIAVEQVVVPGGSRELLAEIPGPSSGRAWSAIHMGPDRQRLLAVSSYPACEAQVAELRGGALLSHLDPGFCVGVAGAFLSDGRLLLAAADSQRTRLRLLDSDGREIDSLELGGGPQLVDVVETRPAEALVSLLAIPAGDRKVLVVATDPMRVVRSTSGMANVERGPRLRFRTDRPIGRHVLLQSEPDGSGISWNVGVVLYDVETGRWKHVAGERLEGSAAPPGADEG